jgi:hypothetical protein
METAEKISARERNSFAVLREAAALVLVSIFFSLIIRVRNSDPVILSKQYSAALAILSVTSYQP